MNDRTKQIALAGITAALSLVFAVLGVYVDMLTATFGVLSAIVLMLPLSKGKYLAACLGYVAAGLLLMLFASPVLALPYITVFGGYTLFSVIAKEKKLSPYVAYPIKAIWINGVLALLYFGVKTLVIDYSAIGFELKYGYLAVIVTVLGLIYDFILLYFYAKFKQLSERYFKNI